MARDEGLEELLREDLKAEQELTEKGMFGGRAWLLNGKLPCGARRRNAGQTGQELETAGRWKVRLSFR